MFRGLKCACLVWTCLAMAPGVQADEHRIAVLTGSQETTPTGSPAIGCATFVIDPVANTVSYYIVFSGLVGAETAAHIHGYSGPGANSSPKHTLPAGNPKVGVWNYAEADEPDILGGRAYVNIHSTVHGGGEIRGQIVTHFAQLDGAQETTPTGSPATGWAVFNADTAANTLSYHIVHNVVGETVAHLHGYAAHGGGAPPVHTLPPGSPKVGTWNYTESVEQAILDGMVYVNIHNATNPSGDIRGQVVRTVAPVDGTQEVPGNVTPGAGFGLISIDRVNDVLGYDIGHAGLIGAENNAHIHGFAVPGVSAGVLHPLALGARKLGAWNYAAGQEADILAGLTYINIHSTFDGSGEIRGQIEPPPLPCPGDADCDGDVDLSDLAALLGSFGSVFGDPSYHAGADTDGDGDNDLSDLATILSLFGASCP